MASHSPEADAAPWRALFFEMLRKTGNVSAAARHAGRARAQLYHLRKQDTAFAALWDDALEEAADWLELEALRRAMDGTVEGRYFRGEMIGTITRYSDSLLMFLLKARRPLVFGTSQARRAAQKALADIGLDDPAARDDLADLRAALASGRRLRFGLLQQLLGWCVQGLMLLVALGVIMLASGAD